MNSQHPPTLCWPACNQSVAIGSVTSVCGRYTITWGDTAQGRWFNAWFGDSPRKHLTATLDKELAKTVCEQHAQKYQSPRRDAA